MLFCYFVYVIEMLETFVNIVTIAVEKWWIARLGSVGRSRDIDTSSEVGGFFIFNSFIDISGR